MKYLFIGGPADGQHIEVPNDAPFYNLPILSHGGFKHETAEGENFQSLKPSEDEKELYVKDSIMVFDKRFFFFYADSIRLQGAIVLLFKNYHPQ